MTAKKSRLHLGQAAAEADYKSTSEVDRDETKAKVNPEKEPDDDTNSGAGADTTSGGGDDTTSANDDDANKEKTTKTWQSGDWRRVLRKSPPFNGLKITAVYGSKTTPDGVDVTFDDFTFSAKGVASEIQNLTVVDGWTPVPQPPTSPKGHAKGAGHGNPNEAAPQFTVTGEVRIEKYVNGKFLRIRLSYGMPKFRREELGLIFSVD